MSQTVPLTTSAPLEPTNIGTIVQSEGAQNTEIQACGTKRGAHSIAGDDALDASRKRSGPRDASPTDPAHTPLDCVPQKHGTSACRSSNTDTTDYQTDFDWDPVRLAREGKLEDFGSVLDFPPHRYAANDDSEGSTSTATSDCYYGGGGGDMNKWNPLPTLAPSEPLDISSWAAEITQAALTTHTGHRNMSAPACPYRDKMFCEYQEEEARTPPSTGEWTQWVPDSVALWHKALTLKTRPVERPYQANPGAQNTEIRGMKRGRSIASVDSSRKRARTSGRDDTSPTDPAQKSVGCLPQMDEMSTRRSSKTDVTDYDYETEFDWDPVRLRREGKLEDFGSLFDFPKNHDRGCDDSEGSTLTSDCYYGGDDDADKWNPLPRLAPSEPLDISSWAAEIAQAEAMTRVGRSNMSAPACPYRDKMFSEYQKEKAMSPPTIEWTQWVPASAALWDKALPSQARTMEVL